MYTRDIMRERESVCVGEGVRERERKKAHIYYIIYIIYSRMNILKHSANQAANLHLLIISILVYW